MDVLVFIALVAGCCYFRRRRQHQSRASHTKVLCHIVAGTNRHSSTMPRTQSGAYPGPAATSVVAPSDPIFIEPAHGAISYPTVRYSVAFASCGLSGCPTTYNKVPVIQHVPVVPLAPPLALTHEVVAFHTKTVKYHLEVRPTCIYSLSC